MSIFDFTTAGLEEIRRADEEIERRHRDKKRRNTENCGGDRRSAEFKAKQHNNHLGNPVWEYRVKYNMTQRELAKKLYVTQETVSAMERGKSRISRYVLEWLREHGEAV